jgi:UDP-N-acetylglucosamine/UDP-N-acetylgalactosamine 4-epimerase
MLITGGAGFIGSNLIHSLVKAGQSVTILDDFSTGFRHNLEDVLDRITLIEGSIEDRALVAEAVKSQTEVIHLAALGSVPRSFLDPSATHAVNATGFLNVLTASAKAGVKRFVYASSSSVYGDSPALPKREQDTGHVLSPYAATKAINEDYARTLGPRFGMSTVGLRFFNVFGARQSTLGAYAAVIPLFMKAAQKGEPLKIYGDGEQSRDFTYIDNVVKALTQAVDAPLPQGEAIACNIGCGDRITLNEVARLIVDIAKSNSDIVHMEERPGDIRHSLADISLAGDKIGYDPQISVREGLKLAYDWYSKHL